jgi:hypothetical protein
VSFPGAVSVGSVEQVQVRVEDVDVDDDRASLDAPDPRAEFAGRGRAGRLAAAEPAQAVAPGTTARQNERVRASRESKGACRIEPHPAS